MQWQFSQFHFLRPEWLILLPFVVALWWFIRKASAHQQWRQYFPQVMLEALQVNGTQRSNVWHWWLLISWLLLTLAMSGPTWICLLYTSPSPRDATLSRMPSSA